MVGGEFGSAEASSFRTGDGRAFPKGMSILRAGVQKMSSYVAQHVALSRFLPRKAAEGRGKCRRGGGDQ